jgi:hypothetical protein
MVRRGSVGSALACCKAGPSSILGSAPQGRFPHWAHKRWGYGERLRRVATDECIVIEWMYVCYKKISKIKQRGWHPATKNFTKSLQNSCSKIFVKLSISVINEYLKIFYGIRNFHFIKIPHFYEHCRHTKSKKYFFRDNGKYVFVLNLFDRCCGTCPCSPRTTRGWTRQPGRRRYPRNRKRI